MKKFRFRLERVRQYRDILKKEKEHALALKNTELHQAETHLTTIVDAQNKAPKAEEGKTTMAELSLFGNYTRYLQEALVRQRVLVMEATHAVEQARDAYIEKAVEAESLETLKEKRRQEYLLETKRADRRVSDRLTTFRHRLKGKSGGGRHG